MDGRPNRRNCLGTPTCQECSSPCRLLLFYYCSSCSCFRARGIVSVVCLTLSTEYVSYAYENFNFEIQKRGAHAH